MHDETGAYTLKREGPRGRESLIKIGTAVISEEVGGVHFVRIESFPVEDFNGKCVLASDTRKPRKLRAE